jgi:hypothetical protein
VQWPGWEELAALRWPPGATASAAGRHHGARPGLYPYPEGHKRARLHGHTYTVEIVVPRTHHPESIAHDIAVGQGQSERRGAEPSTSDPTWQAIPRGRSHSPPEIQASGGCRDPEWGATLRSPGNELIAGGES